MKLFFSKLQYIISCVEKVALCLLLGTIILVACAQIILRGLFSGGLLWADTLLRHLVLWSGLLGACYAITQKKHISLDLAGYLIPNNCTFFVEALCDLFSTTVAAALFWAAVLFLRDEIAYNAAPLLSLGSWLWQTIFPVAFFLIACRSLTRFLASLSQLAKTFSKPRNSCC